MKILIRVGLLLWGLYYLLACRHTEPDPFLDGKPRIKSISFSGIPQENISIDQNARLITVRTPAKLTGMPLVSMELTDSAVWVNNKIVVAAPVLIGAAPGFEFIIQHKTNKNAQTIYTITSQPTGPLQVDQLSAPLSYSLQDGSDGFPYGIKIPMLNLYGNAVPKEAHLIHDATGEITIVKRGEPASGVSGVNYNEPNFIGVELYEVKMRLGSYHIELIQDDGSVLKVGQPLLVNKGHVYIEYEGYTYFGYQVVAGGSFIITGSSLFDGDISVLLKDTTDRTFPLSNLAFNPYGQQVRVTIPSNLKPGQYVLQLLVDGALLTCLRLNIASDATTRPILGTLITSRVSEAVPCSIREPVPAAKETALFFTSNQSKQQLDKAGQHVVLKLIPNQGGDAYYASVVPFDGANTGFPGSFTIPGNVPTGLYTAILQVLDAQNKAVAESVPYGRPLNVP